MLTANKIKYPAWPYIADDEIEAVSAVLRSGKINYWTGDQGRQFENKFAEYIGCKHAIALANGTLALELALKAIKIQAGDEVIVPSKTFIATASAVVACQAIPVIADVNLAMQNITAENILPLISSRTKAIIVVHMGGLACDMDPIMALAAKYNLTVIEDCAQAHGARYKNRLVGSIGDVSAFSFCQDKIMTTGGEGGMLLTNDSEIWQRAWEYKDHGKDYFAVHDASLHKTPGFKWLHNSFGSNYRLSEIQSAIGLLQLNKLPQWLKLRRRNAEFLLCNLRDIPGLKVLEPSTDYLHAYYKFYFHLDLNKLHKSWSKTKILAALGEMAIPCLEGTCSEIYCEQAFVQSGLGPQQPLPNAQALTATSLLLPVHPTLELEHLHSMVEGLQAVIQQAVKG